MSTRTARDPILPGISVAIVGGNCNNGANCGARYLNLNNDAGNANWNIGASPALKGYLKTYSSEWLSPCFVAGCWLKSLNLRSDTFAVPGRRQGAGLDSPCWKFPPSKPGE